MPRASQYDQHRLYILRSVRTAAAQHSRAPTVRELAFELNVSGSTIHSYLRQLAAEGLVEWQPRSHRTLHLTLRGFRLLSSPAAPQS